MGRVLYSIDAELSASHAPWAIDREGFLTETADKAAGLFSEVLSPLARTL
jgi:hypothetical protein